MKIRNRILLASLATFIVVFLIHYVSWMGGWNFDRNGVGYMTTLMSVIFGVGAHIAVMMATSKGAWD